MKAWGLVLMQFFFYTATVDGNSSFCLFHLAVRQKREGVRHKRHWLLDSLINL